MKSIFYAPFTSLNMCSHSLFSLDVRKWKLDPLLEFGKKKWPKTLFYVIIYSTIHYEDIIFLPELCGTLQKDGIDRTLTAINCKCGPILKLCTLLDCIRSRIQCEKCSTRCENKNSQCRT